MFYQPTPAINPFPSLTIMQGGVAQFTSLHSTCKQNEPSVITLNYPKKIKKYFVNISIAYSTNSYGFC